MVSVHKAPLLLPSVYRDWDDRQFGAEHERVMRETAIEASWCSGQQRFTDIDELRAGVATGTLVRVPESLRGLRLIRRLAEFEDQRYDPQHPYHYSPPYARPGLLALLMTIGVEWSSAIDDDRWQLAITSLVRHTGYQQRLASISRKLARPTGQDGGSSHEYGYAVDLDACGLYFSPGEGEVTAVNPNSPLYPKHSAFIVEARDVLLGVLSDYKSKGVVNVVEELQGTREHCVHLCANPAKVT